MIDLKYQAAIDSIIDEYKNRKETLGIILYGSLATGEYVVGKSDIDILIITDAYKSYKSKKIINNINICLLILSYRSAILNTLNFADIIINNLTICKVLFKRSEIIDFLLKLAEKTESQGLPPKSKYYILMKRFKFYSLINDIIPKVTEDKISAEYILFAGFYEIVREYYNLNRIWTPIRYNIINDLKERDKKLYNLCYSFYNSGTVKDKFDFFTQTVDYILQPFGGDLPEEWTFEIM